MPRPVSMYGRSKAAMERRPSRRVRRPAGDRRAPAGRLRPARGRHLRDDPGASRGVFPVVGDGRARRLSLVHVRDLVDRAWYARAPAARRDVLRRLASAATAGTRCDAADGGRARDGASCACRSRRAVMGAAGRVSEWVGRARGRFRRSRATRPRPRATRGCAPSTRRPRAVRVRAADDRARPRGWPRPSRGTGPRAGCDRTDGDAARGSRGPAAVAVADCLPRCVGPMVMLWYRPLGQVRLHQTADGRPYRLHTTTTPRPHPHVPSFSPARPSRCAPARRRAARRSPSPPRARLPPASARITALASRLTLTPDQQTRLSAVAARYAGQTEPAAHGARRPRSARS